MKKLFLKKSLQLITKYKDYTEDDQEKLLYGLEGIYLTFIKLIIIALLSIILGIFKEVILLLIMFNIIRYTGFGFHAEKSSQCLVFSTTIFVIFPFIMLNIKFNLLTILIIYGICLLSYILFAPADTVKRPLPNKKKRKIRKLCTIGTSLIYLILMLIINNNTFTAITLCALITQTIVIVPLTYKIFKQPYNNYKTYQVA